MLKKTITYTDFNDQQHTEEFYFNLTKAEITEMELGTEGGLTTHLNRIVATRDGGQIMSAFKEILLKSYGVRSEDGKRFIKSEQLSQEFSETDAYSELFMSLVTDAGAAAAFVRGIMPQSMAEKMDTIDLEKLPLEQPSVDDTAELPEDDRPAWIREDREPTKKELQTMSKAELIEVMQRKSANQQ